MYNKFSINQTIEYYASLKVCSQFEMELKLPTLNPSWTKWIWFVVLTVQNTILMFDRVSFSSILQDIAGEICGKKPEDACDDKAMGFVNSFFFIVAIISSPIGGSLGDRISRKYLLIIGLCIWSGFVFLMTFMTEYWPFLIVKGISAVGVLLFSNITPSEIPHTRPPASVNQKSTILTVF